MGELQRDWAAHDPWEHRVQRLVLGLAYRPGWLFRLGRTPGGVALLQVAWSVPDNRGGSGRSLLVATVDCGCGYLQGDDAMHFLLHRLWDAIAQLEAHERLELLCYEGARIWEPHPPGQQGVLLASPPRGQPLPV